MAHLQVLVTAWRAESKRRKTAADAYVETQFLPAALEITETPPSPVGRAVLWVVMAAAATALAWSFLSEMDTVAVAEGRLVPAGRLRSVEAAEIGVIRAIAVREGQHVRAGQTLISLDPTMANADAGAARTELSTAALVRARANALLAFSAGRPANFIAPDGADPLAAAAERQLIGARIREYQARRGGVVERRAAGAATVRLTDANITKLEQTIPLASRQLEAYETLAAKGYSSRLRLIQEQERAVALRQELRAEQARRDEAIAQVASLNRELAQIAEAFAGQAAQERAEAEAIVATRGEAVRKTDQRQALQTLTAPVSGVVQEVSVTTLGEVAEVGQTLITIVPDGERLVLEALVLNKDIGTLQAGAQVAVKLEAYPFTRHGTLKGVLEQVSPDAIVDEKRGLVFPARIRLTGADATSRRAMRLSPGMAATAEIVTGRRRVIDYLWSPIAKTVTEAGREP
ncbi:MAG: HlyD family type I secretion periplasmic adaptor subunit [Phenylobacterium sp.]|uniref:HlyD family type I secretion periplasmic adaptor subunit n=1 Tax=Phenylobacterium sp. TaxID=1871053 RepID=UPI0027373DB9|nr:HlyD family type I secretion periplasmic adaptor subunit [Phenylobacterium sp.]MDP3749266.1 HlyD family type I secretion periplasmic adaptor subunit [Phenylobacterium sp.]